MAAAKLALHYDRQVDILYLTSRPPYPEQDTEELGHDIVARLNPDTGDVESLEILFFPRGRSGIPWSFPSPPISDAPADRRSDRRESLALQAGLRLLIHAA
jgi:uncharacterized protein YuzE